MVRYVSGGGEGIRTLARSSCNANQAITIPLLIALQAILFSHLSTPPCQLWRILVFKKAMGAYQGMAVKIDFHPCITKGLGVNHALDKHP